MDMTAWDAVKTVFAAERKANGTVARMNFECCASCAGARLAPKLEAGKAVVFFHKQEAASYQRTGQLSLHFDAPTASAKGSLALRLVAALKGCGVAVQWEGNLGLCILVGDRGLEF